jgi:hypothetical protein
MRSLFVASVVFLALTLCSFARASSPGDGLWAVALGPGDSLTVVVLRHAEKPKKGDNLNCQGLNRSLALPAMLYNRFGLPAAVYVPSMAFGDNTLHSRMFQTMIPFAARYNLSLTSKFGEDDTEALASAVLQRTGVVMIIWEHKRIPDIVRALGVRDADLHWPDDDYDSLWIITFKNGAAHLEHSIEGLKPAEACPF